MPDSTAPASPVPVDAALLLEVAELVVSALNLDVPASEIKADEPLYGDGLGLDSVDALELGLAVQKTFNFQFDGEKDKLREHFTSVKTLADFVRSRQA